VIVNGVKVWPHVDMEDPDIIELEDQMTRWHCEGMHYEFPEPVRGMSYKPQPHEGYALRVCRLCTGETPTVFIVARSSRVEDCGRWAHQR